VSWRRPIRIGNTSSSTIAVKIARLEIALDYAKKTAASACHDNREFLGVIANHNLAFSLISPAQSTARCLADDFIFPECVMRMVDLAEANPTIGMVGTYLLAGKRVLCDGSNTSEK